MSKKKLAVMLFFVVFICVFSEECKIEPKASLFFTGKDDCSKELAERISRAKKSVYFCTYSFTDAYVGTALIRAKKRGVEVAGVTEKDNRSNKGAQFPYLKGAGVEIYLDNNSSLMHHKFVIIDMYMVGTGSFNWTKNANERNNENLIFLESKELAEAYYKEFKEVFWKAKYQK